MNKIQVCVVFFFFTKHEVNYCQKGKRTDMQLQMTHFPTYIGAVARDSCKKIFWKFHRKTPVLESLFNKVEGLHLY